MAGNAPSVNSDRTIVYSGQDKSTSMQGRQKISSSTIELPSKAQKSSSETLIKPKPMPLGPFNEGVPKAFKSAIPSRFHRGILCQQPVTDTYEPMIDEDQLDIVTVMGLEVEDLSSENDSQHLRKQNYDLVDKQMLSRVNLPKLQFVNRDKKEINAIKAFKHVALPTKGSRNDLSDEEDADIHDFEVPFMDLCGETFPMKARLTNIIKDGVVYTKQGSLVCQDDRIAPSWFLHCHICDKRGFVRLDQYHDHLSGEMHKTMSKLHLEKLKAGLSYLRAGAKRAEVRLAMGLLQSSADPSSKMSNFCDVCGCNVYELRLHMQLPQHKIVEKFIFPECCGEKFRNRVEFDEHRCTPQHLRELFKERLALSNRLVEGRLKNGEDQQSLPEYLRLLKGGCVVNDDDTTVNLTPYDPDRPNVVKMLKYYGVIQCVCCGVSFNRQQLEDMYEHVHSIEHYEAAVLYTTQRERSVLTSIAKRREEYPSSVRTHCQKVVKVANALVKDGRERAAQPAAVSSRKLPPPSLQRQRDGPHVALVEGEPVVREIENRDKEQEEAGDTGQQDNEFDQTDLDNLMDEGESY